MVEAGADLRLIDSNCLHFGGWGTREEETWNMEGGEDMCHLLQCFFDSDAQLYTQMWD